MNDPSQTVDHAEQHDAPVAVDDDGLQPESIGRYRIERILGQGGFGLVYLAHDAQLQRPVAIKVPHRSLVARAEDAESYLIEARTVANIDHPHIVPVHDVGSTQQFPCYVVSKYIDGADLATRLKQSQLSLHEAVELTATVAEALHHAHKQGLVHRDIKPGNILLDRGGKPFVADFGLALREQTFGQGSRYAGTPAYMSPEQARGEGHRVDGRSDIFSLGVVLYELLTGRRPFRASAVEQVLEQITNVEARPLRQIDDRIPKELERICLKALSKRATERYPTARDLADDLRHFLGKVTSGEWRVESGERGSAGEGMPIVSNPAAAQRTPQTTAMPVSPTAYASDSQPIKIVPKGLRSFDAGDADFFLELLPGPRDREGLPDSIRFWKSRIETTDADNTFAVGLIYGPSGCGKSSLVKAGLLPRLANRAFGEPRALATGVSLESRAFAPDAAKHVVAIYVEATGEETEARLLNGLRRQLPDLTSNLGLAESLAALRRGRFLESGQKVLLVLDQFEQWLHAKRNEESADLVQALRQCDGGRVQCIVMVRDDFWMAATRFMRELEVKLVEGQNSTAVDLFPIRHAEKVLAAFGRAFGELPPNPGNDTKEQKQFVEQAIAGLAQDGKIISVRLALFADMVKGKPWVPVTLKETGGTEGVGVTFLEETFTASTAPPQHRLHQKAAQAVLRALLPESGTDIKGHMRSYAELLAASGYANLPKDFDDLLRILDSEIRLITPTDPEGTEGAEVAAFADVAAFANVAAFADVAAFARTREAPGIDPAPHSGESGYTRYYQLTHDYLVPSLRDWLTRKQKETRRGRAELLLADRAAVWNARPENRQLPSLLQWLRITWLAPRKNWTPPQRKMMRKASRYHTLRGLAATAIIALLGLVGWESFGRLKAQNLCDRLLEASTADVPRIVGEMYSYHRWVDPLLRDAYAKAERADDQRKQLHASLALYRVDPDQMEYLYGRLLKADPQEAVLIREFLASGSSPSSDDLIWFVMSQRRHLEQGLWTLLENPKNDQDQRFRAACALVRFDPNNSRWQKVSGDVAAILVVQKPFAIGQWTDSFKRVGEWLIPPLADFLADENRSISERGLIASIYGTYAANVPDAYGRLERQLAESNPPSASVEAKIDLAKRQANIAVALLIVGQPEKVWPLLKHSPDPTLRTFLIERLGLGGVDSKVLTARLDEEAEVSARRAILLSLGQFGPDRLSQDQRQNLLPRLPALYRNDPDPGIHGAAEWLLRQWEATDQLAAIDKELATKPGSPPASASGSNRQWYINRQGQTMTIVANPTEFWMGEGEQPRQRRHRRRIGRRFAIAAKEVTVEQFLRFHKDHQIHKPYAPTNDCPANKVGWYDAAAYCNWLSEQEGIPKDQWCYVPNEAGMFAAGMKLAPNYLQRTGYRLPTEAEWEYACRAGSETGYSFGEKEENLNRYAWFNINSLTESHPVGMLKPNELGLFDMHGNAWEWTQDIYKEYTKEEGGKAKDDIEGMTDVKDADSRVLRGGTLNAIASNVRSALRINHVPTSRHNNFGFRAARTYP